MLRQSLFSSRNIDFPGLSGTFEENGLVFLRKNSSRVDIKKVGVKMKGSESRLIEYMEGSKKRFIIPVYQRNYDWRAENCKQLYDDLVKVIKSNR